MEKSGDGQIVLESRESDLARLEYVEFSSDAVHQRDTDSVCAELDIEPIALDPVTW